MLFSLHRRSAGCSRIGQWIWRVLRLLNSWLRSLKPALKRHTCTTKLICCIRKQQYCVLHHNDRTSVCGDFSARKHNWVKWPTFIFEDQLQNDTTQTVTEQV